MRVTRRAAVCGPMVAALVLCACGQAPSSRTRDAVAVDFTASDGMQLKGTLYRAAEKRPSGLLLVHMLGSDRSAWHDFALKARNEGYTCLAFDMRGHGESTQNGQDRISYRTFDTNDWLAVTADIEAAKKVLLEQGVHPSHVGIAGASIGANLALAYARRDPAIQAVALLSPGLDYHGVALAEGVADSREMPLLLMSAQGDTYSASSCAELKRLAPGYCELRTYPGSAHGTNLLVNSDNAAAQILQWLDGIIGRSARKAEAEPF